MDTCTVMVIIADYKQYSLKFLSGEEVNIESSVMVTG